MTEPAKPPLRAVPGKQEVPPWDRPHLRAVMGGSEDAKPSKIDARITAARDRAISKLLSQRILPEIETKTDLVNAGIGMVFFYAKLYGKNSEDFRKAVEFSEWESEVAALELYEERLTRLLDSLDAKLAAAQKSGQRIKFKKLFATLEKYKDDIDDEGLSIRAKKMWVLYREYAREE
jgi:hypothetical protein